MKTMSTMCLFMSIILPLIFLLMTEASNQKKDKKTPFECGFEALSEKKMTFATSFIMLMVMFLIFDVEISILIPFTLMNKNNQTSIMCVSALFIITLTVMLMKEWEQGALEWSK